jgi:uncharacterized membrane protein YecN with MAPEG domain
MSLTQQQQGVLPRMLVGVCLAITLVATGSFCTALEMESAMTVSGRIAIAIQSLLLPAGFLVISVGRLARHRFFTAQDIDSGSSSADSERAGELQSILQNTLEQFCIAAAVYLGWAVVMPAHTASVIPLAAVAFALGRLLFFAGFRNGASARALGFTLTFYPAVVMLLCIAGFSLLQLFH